MNCPNCGTENTNNATFCIECNHELQPPQEQQPAAPPPPQPPPQMPPGAVAPPHAAAPPAGSIPNYLVQSILITIFCCLPLGIVAIVYAAQVNAKQAAGDFFGAQESSDKAKMWCWWGFGIGLAGAILYFGVMMLGILSGLASGQ